MCRILIWRLYKDLKKKQCPEIGFTLLRQIILCVSKRLKATCTTTIQTSASKSTCLCFIVSPINTNPITRQNWTSWSKNFLLKYWLLIENMCARLKFSHSPVIGPRTSSYLRTCLTTVLCLELCCLYQWPKHVSNMLYLCTTVNTVPPDGQWEVSRCRDKCEGGRLPEWKRNFAVKWALETPLPCY